MTTLKEHANFKTLSTLHSYQEHGVCQAQVIQQNTIQLIKHLNFLNVATLFQVCHH
jgi:hypothetical protein